MRILVVGAGAVGGYFGGRLLQAGRDVTFLARPRRADELARTGLAITSKLGDVRFPTPPIVLEDALTVRYDLILLSCKAYDLHSAMDSFAPAVGPLTAILPLLNGINHLETLTARFGAGAVLGGLCEISTALDPEGRILHLNDSHMLCFGELDGERSARVESFFTALASAGYEARLSESILQEMWEKWLFIAAAAGITCLMRATIGDVVAAGAADLAIALVGECATIAARHGFPPRPAFVDRAQAALTAAGSSFTASMLRDIERGARLEADQILGDLLRRGERGADSSSVLRVAYAHVKAYEARRAREQAVAVVTD